MRKLALLMGFFVISTALFGEGASELPAGSSLLIGTISLEAKNWRVISGGITVNGVHTADIVLTFSDLTTGEKTTVKSSGAKGLFYFTPVVGHRYQLSRTYFKVQQGSAWADLWAERAVSSIVVEGLKDGVNVMGHLNWQSDKLAQAQHVVTLEKSFSEVRSDFLSAYATSTWAAVPWNDLGEAPSTAVATAPAGHAGNVAQPTQQIEVKSVTFDDIYPVFRTYYADHPLGKLVLHNTFGTTVSGLKVSFQIKEFMTEPTDCHAPPELQPGESKDIGLYGLFLPAILETTEKTKAQAAISVDYVLNGQSMHQNLVEVVPILDRNATTWADDRRAAAFVTTKDPAVLTFSKNVISMVKGKSNAAVNQNLITAMALFETLQLYGLTYSSDPVPTFTSNRQVADYIQFPRQTLLYKGGKCSDFSVLYSALLESAGIETGFITIPGHIFVAFSTGMSPDASRKSFSHPDELIVRSDKSWVPVEVTESAGFLKAWQDGAREWRENLSKQLAAFYPLHDSWQIYEPVGLSGSDVALSLPQTDAVVGRLQDDANRFVDQEISPRVAALQKEIGTGGDARIPTNSLGVLYAKYGEYDRARKEFEKLLAREEYVPALLNMGNLFYLEDQKEKALEYYGRASAKDPDNPNVLLAEAIVNHDLENYYQVRKVYEKLTAEAPDIAEKYSYLGLKGEEATRAAEISGVESVTWAE
jgi:tetratricopeptide (TPR) repeat protein